MIALLTESQQFALLRQLLEMSNDPGNSLSRLHRDLTDAGVDYVIIGGMALRPYNYERFTEDLDIIVSKDTVHNLDNLHGRGYGLRPGATNNLNMFGFGRPIPVDVLVEGQLNHGISVPNPKSIRQKINGVWVASLPALITLKLQASRTQDIADVRKLIELNELDINYAEQLPQSVQQQFKQLF